MKRLLLSAGRSEIIPGTVPVGVGFLEAGLQLARLLERGEWDEVLFLGTAGSYGKVPPFWLIESWVGVQWEVGWVEGKGYSPIELKVASPRPKSRLKLPPLPKVEGVLNSSHYITTDWRVGQKFLKLGAIGESMEHFGIIRVGTLTQIPVRGLYLVTNYTDSEAHLSYRRNLPKALEILTEIATLNQ
ncbi:MAG: hypothetical protein ABGW77_06065 [Campylobacterales bacterium]